LNFRPTKEDLQHRRCDSRWLNHYWRFGLEEIGAAETTRKMMTIWRILPNKAPLRMPVSGTPAAGSPVEPPTGVGDR